MSWERDFQASLQNMHAHTSIDCRPARTCKYAKKNITLGRREFAKRAQGQPDLIWGAPDAQAVELLVGN